MLSCRDSCFLGVWQFSSSNLCSMCCFSFSCMVYVSWLVPGTNLRINLRGFIEDSADDCSSILALFLAEAELPLLLSESLLPTSQLLISSWWCNSISVEASDSTDAGLLWWSEISKKSINIFWSLVYPCFYYSYYFYKLFIQAWSI